ncbi:MAG TPA: efflux RND transporter permease subunit [Solirubrobacteraceae bacterium]|nr:efflux RND transporter permease subunit [Solirubrobacteraceae bacterium]
MIRAIVGASLRFKGLIVGIAAAIMIVGVITLRDAPVDALPEFTPPYVEIQTESLGLSAPEVEQLLTVPLEADLLNGVEGVDIIRSKSLPGLSTITLVFEPGFDLYKGRQLVQERLTQLGGAAFPNVSMPPTMLQPLSSSSRVMMVGISSKNLTPIQKSVIARWTLRPRLMGVPGVANVSVWGMRDQQIQVQVDPEQLRDKNVSLQQVIRTAGNAQIASPVSYIEASVPGTGGFIETPQQRLQVRNVFDKIADPKELAKVAVEGTGGRLRLSDVSNVVEDHQPLIGDAVVNDAEGLLLVVEKFPGADVQDVSAGVEAALNKLAPGLPGLEMDTTVFRPASFISEATDNLTTTIIIGAILMIFALVAVLMQWRTVLIVLITVPVSLVASALVLEQLGETFNALTFAGLALALALIIDDAVAGAENVARRLAQKRAEGSETSIPTTILEATHEVRAPLGYATLIALLVIVPVVVIEGRPGAFLAPLAAGYVVAVLTATVMAMTLTPALSALLPARDSRSPLAEKLGAWYSGMIGRIVGNARGVLVAVGVLGLVAIVAVATMGTSLVPTLKDRDLLVKLDAPTGTSNPAMTKIASDLSRDVRQIDGVQNVGAAVGRAIGGDRIVDVNSAEVVVSMKSDADYDATREAIADAAGGVQGAKATVTTYSAQELSDVGAVRDGENAATGTGLDVLTGSSTPLAVRVYGQNLDTLKTEAEKVRGIVAGVDGVTEAKVALPPVQPNLQVEVDLDKARSFGVKPGDVRRAAAVLLQGILVGSTFEDQKVFDVVVQGDPKLGDSEAAVKNLVIDRPDGGTVRLGQVANVTVGETPTIIERDAVARKLDIQITTSGRGADAIKSDLEDALAEVKFPLEYHAEVVERTVGEEINGQQVLGVGIAALIAAFLLMQAAIRSWGLAAVAFASLPAALVGGVIGALLVGGDITIGVLIGLMALFGLATRNGIVLIRHLQRVEGERGEIGAEAIAEAARERLAPVLASTAAIAAAMAPFVFMGSTAGLEIVHPMAVVILCGLASSVAVVLFVLPAVYLGYGAGTGTLDEEADEDETPAGRAELPFELGDERTAGSPVS